MPELPEVESVRALMMRALGGKKIREVQAVDDSIVFCGLPPESIQAALIGQRVEGVGRKGKFWWLELESRPWMFGHLGMSGWIRELGVPEKRLHGHGDAPLDDSDGKPRFLKLLIEAEDGARVAFTDGRRLGRIWLGESPDADIQIQRLGPDALDSLPDGPSLFRMLSKRKSPIKALLLNQELFAGVGNYIADEVLYQARLSPKRLGASLSEAEVQSLRSVLSEVLQTAVAVDADSERFPSHWIFHHRWGGGRGSESIDGRAIVRETIGGRTTAWVPEVQF